MNMKKISGFTLIELLMAVVIVNAVALGIFGTMWYSKRISVVTGERDVAMSIADSRMSELKRTGAQALAVTAGPQTGADSRCTSSICETLPDTELKQGLVNTVITGSGKIKEAEVQVYWVDPKGAAKKAALAAYFYEP